VPLPMWMGQPLHHPLSCPPHLEPHIYYAGAPVEMWWAREGFASCPDCGPASTHCFPLRRFLQPDGGRLLVPFGPRPFFTGCSWVHSWVVRARLQWRGLGQDGFPLLAFFLPQCESPLFGCGCFSSFYVWSLFQGHLGKLSNKFFLPGK